ncbi:cytochrome P450 [Spongiactinospora sp. 9N601]|uniref:cytochrome P450 n=1 Tax=Spongiactinospora sp. 9N601 TaxID=3375149 RepID=UPI0037B0B0A2
MATDRETSGFELVGRLLSPMSRPDPYPVYAEFRALGPVWVEEISSLVVTGFRDCEALLRDPRLSAERRRLDPPGQAGDHYPPDAPPSVRQPWFLSLDPPDHTRLRRLVSSAFTARTIARMEDSIARLVDDLLDQVPGREPFDMLSGLAYPLPVTVICRMLGVPPADERLFHRWSTGLGRMLDGFSGPDDGDGEAAESIHGMVELHRYVNELVADRRGRPGREDLISELLAVEDGGDVLGHDELVATIVLLLVAGHETTVNLIANGVLALLRHPGRLAALRADPATAPAVVEEVLRYDPPVQLTARVATEDMRVGAAKVPEGALVILLLAAAHRDPAANPDPDRFDPGRTHIRHLGFGFGPHFCLGAPLARLQGRLALTAFARRLQAPALVTDPPPYRDHINLRGVGELLVTHAGLTR